MIAEVGDQIVAESPDGGEPGRIGTIVGLTALDGRPGFVVHWLVGDYDATIRPGRGIHIKVVHKAHPDPHSTPA